MKTLYIMRHSKADKSLEGITDRQRMLTDTGVTRTYMIAQHLLDSNTKIDQVVCSPAERTYTTALIVADKMNLPSKSVIKEEIIYQGDENEILHHITQLDDSLESVMIVGHNPSITHVANRFASPALESLPTSGVLAVQLHTDRWAEALNAENRQLFAIWPGML